VRNDQDHGELPAEDGAAGIRNVAPQVEEDLGYLGNDARAVTTDDGQGEMVHGVLLSARGSGFAHR
jgi:hypothetical protein